MRSRGLVLVLILLACGISSAADLTTPPANDAERKALLARIDDVGRRGFLYEVRKPGAGKTAGAKKLYLYGTIHLGQVGSEPFNRAVVDALLHSRRLALEADPSDPDSTQSLAMELGRYGADDGLEHHVSPELMARVAAFGEARRMPRDHLVRYKPWLLANMVVLTDFSDSGLDPSMGSEMYLAGFARGRGMPIVEIEGIEPQLKMLAGLPDAMQAAQLDEALDDYGSGTSRSQGLELFALWKAGRSADGDAMIAEMHRNAADKPFERYFLDTLIDARNRSMADRAERYLDEPGNTFFAIGCLHLFGDTGLLREFVRRGYRVVDLQATKPSR